MKKLLNWITTLYLICSQSMLMGHIWAAFPKFDWLFFPFGAHSDFYICMVAGWSEIPGSDWLLLPCLLFQIILCLLGVCTFTGQRYGWYTILVWVDFLLTLGLMLTELIPFRPWVWTNAVYAAVMTTAWLYGRRAAEQANRN